MRELYARIVLALIRPALQLRERSEAAVKEAVHKVVVDGLVSEIKKGRK